MRPFRAVNQPFGTGVALSMRPRTTPGAGPGRHAATGRGTTGRGRRSWPGGCGPADTARSGPARGAWPRWCSVSRSMRTTSRRGPRRHPTVSPMRPATGPRGFRPPGGGSSGWVWLKDLVTGHPMASQGDDHLRTTAPGAADSGGCLFMIFRMDEVRAYHLLTA
jgi:hypothetical protein